jgi:hypothetical protein
MNEIVSKKCSKCKQWKLLTDFSIDTGDTKTGYSYICKNCTSIRSKIYYIKNKEQKKKYRIEHREKYKKYLKKYRDEHKEKSIKTSKEYYYSHKEQILEYKRKYKKDIYRPYNMTIDDYKEMYINQLGNCLVCGKHKDKLCVDHDHKTGEVRGLLCSRCNSGLAYIDDLLFLENALKYVNNPNKKKYPFVDKRTSKWELI